MKKLLITMLLFLSVGCIKTGVLMLTDTKYPPKPKNYNVQVFLEEKPNKPYKKIAMIDAVDEIDANDSRVEALEELIEALQKKCRKIGGDAVIIVSDNESLSSIVSTTKFKAKFIASTKVAFQLNGYVIVWEK